MRRRILTVPLADFNRTAASDVVLPRHLISPPPTVASPQPAIVLRDENGNPKEEYPYNTPVRFSIFVVNILILMGKWEIREGNACET